MQRILPLIITCFIAALITSCSSVSDNSWTALIPENTSYIIIPEENLNVQDITTKEYFSYLDDLTPSALQHIPGIDAEITRNLKLKGLALTPSSSLTSHYLWVAETLDQKLGSWASQFYQPFTQNNYDFNGYTIHKLFFNKDEVFAVQIRNFIVISESSLVVENALRTYLGQTPSIQMDNVPQPGTLIVNSPSLDHWVEQFAAVSNRPAIMNKFAGTKPLTLHIDSPLDSLGNVQLSGSIPLEQENRSVLTDAISYENKPITLDRHIAGNAAAFAILRLPPVSIPSMPADSILSPLDSLLLNDLETYQELSNTLNTEFAFQAFAESGLLDDGEFLYMRKLRDKSTFQSQINQLSEDGLVSRQGNTYHINSAILATLIGSELSTLRDFYLAFSNDVAVIAKRKGLAESVNSDRIRRRVIYYDETYSNIRTNLPSEISGFVWTFSEKFNQFVQPYLKPGNTSAGILNRFDISSISFVAAEGEVKLRINTYAEEGSKLPYEELWVMPLSNFELSGKPVLGDVVGSSANEVIFSTTDGRIMGLASDGTIALQTTTDGLEPVGGPVLYDWYGNGQPIILLAAGSRIFAWNENGNLLPRFPIELDEQISAPILVQDVLRNGVPEIVVATENRKLHVLDGRGENVRGWPQNTNAVISSQPVFEILNNIWSVWAYSENALHSWLRNGSPRPGYPQFVNTRFTDSPIVSNNQVLGSGADGYLYSVGAKPFFDTSTATVISDDSVSIHSLYVANSELFSASIQEGVLLKVEDDFIREDLIATQSTNGSVFLYNKKGELRFTQSLGQPSSATLIPKLTDLNTDQNQELIALAEFGRLYAWEVLTGNRLFNLPTSAMKYPLVTDLNGDGQKELIAQTREGLRCWTINKEN